MTKRDEEELPLVNLNREEREAVWDDTFLKEEGIILEFDNDLNTGRLKSIADGHVYAIDGRELVKTKIELRSGDKVLFAPIEGSSGDDYARIIRIIELNTESGNSPAA